MAVSNGSQRELTSKIGERRGGDKHIQVKKKKAGRRREKKVEESRRKQEEESESSLRYPPKTLPAVLTFCG